MRLCEAKLVMRVAGKLPAAGKIPDGGVRGERNEGIREHLPVSHAGARCKARQFPSAVHHLHTPSTPLQQRCHDGLVLDGIEATGGVAHEPADFEQPKPTHPYLHLQAVKLPPLVRLPMPPFIPVLPKRPVTCETSQAASVTSIMSVSPNRAGRSLNQGGQDPEDCSSEQSASASKHTAIWRRGEE